MKTILNVAIYEINALFKHKALLVFVLILPFVVFWFFDGFMKVGVVRDLPIAIVDNDNTATSRKLIANLEATPTLKVAFNVASKNEGEKLIETTDAYGLVIIPKNFEKDIFLSKQPSVTAEFNNSLLIPAGLESKAARAVVGEMSAQIALKAQLAHGNTIDQAIANLQPVRLQAHTLSNPFTNYRYYLVPALLFAFLQIFVMLSSVYSLGVDLKYGKTNKLIEIGDNNLLSILMGKMLPYTLWFFLLGLVLYNGLFVLQDFPQHGNRMVLLLALFLLIVATQGFAILFVSTSKSLREAMTKGNAIAALSLGMSGFTFPLMGMPVFFKWYAQLFPFTHFFKVFLAQTQRNFPVYYVIPGLFILAIMTFVLLLYGGIKYKQMLLKGQYPSIV